MKLLAVLCVLTAALTSGCASTVTTYNADGKMIGKCVSQSGMILAGGATCAGHANAEQK